MCYDAFIPVLQKFSFENVKVKVNSFLLYADVFNFNLMKKYKVPVRCIHFSLKLLPSIYL